MKLRYQLYLFLFFLSAILVLVLGLNYISYKNQYEKDRKNFINSEVRLHKKAILNSIQNRNSDFEGKKEFSRFHLFSTPLRIPSRVEN